MSKIKVKKYIIFKNLLLKIMLKIMLKWCCFSANFDQSVTNNTILKYVPVYILMVKS